MTGQESVCVSVEGAGLRSVLLPELQSVQASVHALDLQSVHVSVHASDLQSDHVAVNAPQLQSVHTSVHVADLQVVAGNACGFHQSSVQRSVHVSVPDPVLHLVLADARHPSA